MLSLRLTHFRTLQKLMVLVSTPRDADLSGSEREQGRKPAYFPKHTTDYNTQVIWNRELC